MRVAAGGVARKVLGDGVRIRGALVQIGPHRIDRARWDWDAVDDNPFFCPDPRRRDAVGDAIWTRCARPARRPAR